MKKSIYIFVILILISEMYSLKIFHSLFLGGDLGYILLYIWLLFGFIIYRRKTKNPLYKKDNLIPVCFILFGILLSMFSAYILYGQTFIQSLIAYRRQYFWIVVFVLLYVRPSERSIIKSLNCFSIVYIVATFLRTYILPQWFVERELFSAPGVEMQFCIGLPLLTIPMYYYCGRVRNYFELRDFFGVLFYAIFFVLIKNRSVLFVVIIIVAFSFITSKRKKISIPVTFIAGILFTYFTFDTFVELNDETVNQVNDADYNRVKAFDYMLFSSHKDWLAILFGKGFISSHASSNMSNLMSMGIYNTDVGFVGYWDQYGIIPIIVFTFIIIKVLISKFVPFYIKAIGGHILVCSITISYMGIACNIMWFTLFYYLYLYYNYRNRCSIYKYHRILNLKNNNRLLFKKNYTLLHRSRRFHVRS